MATGISHPIVQVSAFYPPHLGGIENVTQTLARTLAKKHEVLVLTTTCGSLGAPRIEQEDHLVIHRTLGIEIAVHTAFPRTYPPPLCPTGRRNVHAKIAQAFLSEVVWLTAKLKRRPFLVHFHLDVDPSGRLGCLLPFYKRHLFGRALRAATYVIALTDEQSTFISETYAVYQRVV